MRKASFQRIGFTFVNGTNGDKRGLVQTHNPARGFVEFQLQDGKEEGVAETRRTQGKAGADPKDLGGYFAPQAENKIMEQPQSPITQESNQRLLRKHQQDLRQSYPSCDMSEVSYHTEHSDLNPGSRHSSLNTEPLTLDADQIHDAKDQAEDVLQQVGPEKAAEIFTKELEVRNEEAHAQESEAEVLAQQINSLVEKAQQVVDANVLHSQSLGNIPGAPVVTSNLKEQSDELAKIVESVPAPLDEDVKSKSEDKDVKTKGKEADVKTKSE